MKQLGNSKLARYLERAQQSGQRARDLIQQMLTFSRGQRGEPCPLSLAPLIREAVQWVRVSLPSSIELRTELAADLPPAFTVATSWRRPRRARARGSRCCFRRCPASKPPIGLNLPLERSVDVAALAGRVLVVDDEPAVGDFMQDLLIVL